MQVELATSGDMFLAYMDQVLDSLRYSPGCNPVNQLWSKLKSVIRCLKASTSDALDEILNHSKSVAYEWFGRWGYTRKTS